MSEALTRFVERLDNAQQNGSGWKSLCPAHKDQNPSLLVRADDNGVVQFQCQAGCDHKAVLAALGISESELYPEQLRRNGHRQQSTDIVADVARLKRIPLESFRAFGAAAAVRGRAPVARVPMFNEKREQCSEFDLGIGNKGLVKGLSAKGKPVGLFVATWPEAGDTVLVTEGPKDAAALHSLGFNVIGLPTCEMVAKFAQVFAGCHVIIVPDRDKAGEHGASVTGSRLYGIAASVRVAPLAAQFKQSGGDGVREVLAKSNGEQLVRDCIAVAVEWIPEPEEPEDDNERIVIRISPLEWKVTDEAIAVLTRDPEVFTRSGELVRIVTDEPPHDGIERPASTQQIRPLLPPTLRERLGKVAKFVTISPDGEARQKPPPDWCLSAIRHRGTWRGIRHLEGIVNTPVLRADGSVLSKPGYDPATGLVLTAGSAESAESAESDLTPDAAKRAVSKLLNLVSDFPFATKAHAAAWVAATLTPFARHGFDGPAPLFLIDANTRGSGKSLLGDVSGYIASGTEMARMSAPRDDDECRKRITSLAIAGDTLVLIDNIVGTLGCASLDAALTSTIWKDRILGKSEIVTMPLKVTWLATGNNVILAADTSRRVCHIRLESPEERPEERSGFKNPHLLRYVKSHRDELVTACLTILAAYCKAGRPDQQLKPWGSFDGWSSLVRNAVVWCGLPDPGETRRELVERSDVQAGALRTLVEQWHTIDTEGEGLLTAEILRRLDSSEFKCEELRSAVMELCGSSKGKPPSAGSLGNKLRHLRGRVIGGKALDCDPTRSGAMKWCVVAIDKRPAPRPETDSADSAESALQDCRSSSAAESAESADSVLATDASRSTKTLSDAEIDHIARAFA